MQEISPAMREKLEPNYRSMAEVYKARLADSEANGKAMAAQILALQLQNVRLKAQVENLERANKALHRTCDIYEEIQKFASTDEPACPERPDGA